MMDKKYSICVQRYEKNAYICAINLIMYHIYE